MLFPSVKTAAALAAGWLASSVVLAQTPEATATPAAPPTQSASNSVASEAEAPTRPLLKVGTGLTRGLAFESYYGLQLPLTLGIEHELRPGWTVYGNVYGSFTVYQRRFLNEFRRPFLPEMGAELGIRRYYNQEKRRQRGRVNGPFTGNYLALQASGSIRKVYYFPTSLRRLRHNHSSLTALWGIQRRLGGHGLLDFYAGAGVGKGGPLHVHQLPLRPPVFGAGARPKGWLGVVTAWFSCRRSCVGDGQSTPARHAEHLARVLFNGCYHPGQMLRPPASA